MKDCSVTIKHLDLFVQTAFEGTKKGNLATPTGVQAPIFTPEATRGTVSNNRISKKSEAVNADFDDSQNVKYQYRGVNDHGIEVYETSEEIKTLTYDDRTQKFLDLMKNEYRGRTAKFIRNGNVYYALFEDADVRKNIYGDKRSSPKG